MSPRGNYGNYVPYLNVYPSAAKNRRMMDHYFPRRRRTMYKRSSYSRRPRLGYISPGYTRTAGNWGRYQGTGGGGSELKWHDETLTDAIVAPTGGVFDSLNLIPQNTTENGRIGRKVTVISIAMRYEVVLPQQDKGSTAVSGDVLRVMIYVDKQCNGATATVGNLLQTAAYMEYRNMSEVGRFQVLYDKNHSMNYANLTSETADTVSASSMTRFVSVFKKVSIPLEFDSTTGAIGEIRSNNIGVLVISSIGVVGFLGNTRIRYSDK